MKAKPSSGNPAHAIESPLKAKIRKLVFCWKHFVSKEPSMGDAIPSHSYPKGKRLQSEDSVSDVLVSPTLESSKIKRIDDQESKQCQRKSTLRQRLKLWWENLWKIDHEYFDSDDWDQCEGGDNRHPYIGGKSDGKSKIRTRDSENNPPSNGGS
jgi:hypothetical protein